jgi:DNA-directed RNA polymerase sigma subunit (sigma70/sigma32)
MTFSDKKLTELYNDFISKLHELGMTLKSMNGENELLKVNLNRAIRNCIVLSLNEPKTLHEISEKIGIDTDHIQQFLEAMVKDKSLVKDGEKYHKKS